MKWRLSAALIGSVSLITGTAQAQHHNNMHMPLGTNPGWGAAQHGVADINYPSATALGTAHHHGHMNHDVGGAVEQAGYYRHGVPFAQPASVVNASATPGIPPALRNAGSSYMRPYRYEHEGLPYATNRFTTRKNGDVLMPQAASIRPFEGRNLEVLLRKNVQNDKIAINNDLATGDNVRLRQDEQRLQVDQRADQMMEHRTSNNNQYLNMLMLRNAQQFNRPAMLTQQDNVSARELRRQQFQALHTRPGSARANDELARVHAAHKGSSAKAAALHVVKSTP